MKEELKELIDDVLYTLEVLLLVQKPRIITETVRIEETNKSRLIFSDLAESEKTGLKTYWIAQKRVQIILNILKEIFSLQKSGHNCSLVVVLLNLDNMISTLIRILSEDLLQRDRKELYILGMPTVEYYTRLQIETKTEISRFLTNFVSNYANYLISYIPSILDCIHHIIPSMKNYAKEYPGFRISFINLVCSCLQSFGAAFYEGCTEMLFTTESSIEEELVGDLVILTERYDTTVVRFGEQEEKLVRFEIFTVIVYIYIAL